MIVIVGGGAAAISAAVALRELGYDGEVRLYSAEAAVPYDRTTLSKTFLTNREADPPPVFELPDIELSLDTAITAIKPVEKTVTTCTGETVAIEKVLIATGARSRVLEIPGSNLRGIHYLRELDDATRLRGALQPGSRVLIIGGGVIGLEIASSAAQLDCTTTVVEAAPRVMGRVLPAELADAVTAQHRARGVAILTGTPPARFVGVDGRVQGVLLADGTEIGADVVVVGIGIVPRTELAAEAGFSTANGIVVDEHLRTSHEAIFAAGDAAGILHIGEARRIRTESWRPAGEQGRIAAANMLGIETPYRKVPWMWSDQHDLLIQVTGFGFGGAEIVRRGSLSDRDGVCYFALRGHKLVAAAGASFGQRIARSIRSAQMLIEAQASVEREQLCDPDCDLKRLLSSTMSADDIAARSPVEWSGNVSGERGASPT